MSWQLLGGILGNSWNPLLGISAASLGTNTLYPASLDLVFILVPLGTILSAFWNSLGRSWAHLGGVLESSRESFGQLLKPTPEHHGNQPGYKHFVPCFFGSCVYPGASWNDLGRILEPVGTILGSSWNLLGDLGIILEPLLRIL